MFSGCAVRTVAVGVLEMRVFRCRALMVDGFDPFHLFNGERSVEAVLQTFSQESKDRVASRLLNSVIVRGQEEVESDQLPAAQRELKIIHSSGTPQQHA